jgi:hypothetical protein
MNRRSFLGSLLLLPLVAARALRGKPAPAVPNLGVSVPWDLAKGYDFSRMWFVSNPSGVCDHMINIHPTPVGEVERVMMTWTKSRDPAFQGRTVELQKTTSGKLVVVSSGKLALTVG